jgi:hypothetical protein
MLKDFNYPLTPKGKNAAEELTRDIIANYNNQLESSTIDLPAHVESLLQSLGATTSDSGGKVTCLRLWWG